MNIKLIVFLLLLFPLSICGQIKIGDKIQLNQLHLTALTQTKIDPSKVIVLDFWATWCAPCIAAFPHLDSIQKSFQKDVQVIAVSDESPANISKFLKTRNYTFPFFADESKQLFKLFDVESRPLTAVIQPDGTFSWIGSSKDLGSVLRNTDTKMPTVSAFSLKKYFRDAATPKEEPSIYTYQISLSEPSDEYEAKTQKGTRIDSAINIYYRATSVVEIIQDLVSVSDLQLRNSRVDLDTILINITAKSTSNQLSYKSEKEKIILDLQRVFNFTIKKGFKEFDTYLLEIIDEQKFNKYEEDIPGGGMVQTKGNQYEVTRLSLSELASFFQKKLGVFIAYPGDERRKYKMTLDKFENIEELNHQLATTFGLRLKPSRTSVEIVEIK